VSQGRVDVQPGRVPGAFSNRFLTEATELECTILLLSRRCLEKSPCAVLLVIDKLVFGSILEFVAYPLVFSVIAKEVPTMIRQMAHWLHSPERRPRSAFCYHKSFPPGAAHSEQKRMAFRLLSPREILAETGDGGVEGINSVY
jgi:hypothetical protein